MYMYMYISIFIYIYIYIFVYIYIYTWSVGSPLDLRGLPCHGLEEQLVKVARLGEGPGLS